MAGFINKERVVFAGAFVFLASQVLTLVQGALPLPDVPRKPSYVTPKGPDAAPLPAFRGAFAGWDPDARNPFMPRQEFADLAPAMLDVPPAPLAKVVSAVPYPRPAAGAAGKFRRAVSGTPLDLNARPAPAEDDE